MCEEIYSARFFVYFFRLWIIRTRIDLDRIRTKNNKYYIKKVNVEFLAH